MINQVVLEDIESTNLPCQSHKFYWGINIPPMATPVRRFVHISPEDR